MKNFFSYLLIGLAASALIAGICLYANWCAERELNRYDTYERLANP